MSLELGGNSLCNTPVSDESVSSAAVPSRWSDPPMCTLLPAPAARVDSHSAGGAFSYHPTSCSENRKREQTILLLPL